MKLAGTPQSDQQVLQEMEKWFIDCLGCVVGRNEYMKNRYLVSVVRLQPMLRLCTVHSLTVLRPTLH